MILSMIWPISGLFILNFIDDSMINRKKFMLRLVLALFYINGQETQPQIDAELYKSNKCWKVNGRRASPHLRSIETKSNCYEINGGRKNQLYFIYQIYKIYFTLLFLNILSMIWNCFTFRWIHLKWL